MPNKWKKAILPIVLGGLLLIRLEGLGKSGTPDEPYWMLRSKSFVESVSNGNWEETLHLKQVGERVFTVQGVITRWIVGTTLKDKGATRDNLALGQRAIVIATTILCATLAFAVSKLFKAKDVGLIVLFVLLTDGFLLALSRVVHVDAILSLLLGHSIVLGILGFREKNNLYTLLSGITAGMAILQKAPALAIGPFMLLTCLVYWFENKSSWKEFFRLGLIWLGGLVLGTFTFYPALWVVPRKSIELYFKSTFIMVKGSTEGTARVFSLLKSSGTILFYIAMLIIKAGLLEMAGLGALVFAFTRNRSKYSKELILMTSFCVIFLLQMATGKAVVHRYILPVHLVLLLITSYGLTTITKGRKFFLTGLLLAQTTVLAFYYPYYFLFKNPFVPNTAYEIYDSTWGLGVEKATEYAYEQAEEGTVVFSVYYSIPEYKYQKNNPKKIEFASTRLVPCEYVDKPTSYIVMTQGNTINYRIKNFLEEQGYKPEKTFNFKGIQVSEVYKIDAKISTHLKNICTDNLFY